MPDCSAIQTKLDEALSAFHRLTTGGSVRVIVDTDGSRIEYNAANSSKLSAYIQLLQAQLAECQGTATTVAVTRPINFVF